MGKSPRLQVVLAPEVYDSIARISRYTAKSMSAVVSDTLSDAAPILHQLADTLEHANSLSMKLPSSVAAKLQDLDRDAKLLEQGVLSVFEQFQKDAAQHEELMRSVQSIAGQVQGQEQLGREALSIVEQFQKDAAQYEELMHSVQSLAGQVQGQEQLGREALSIVEQFQKDAAQHEELMRSAQSFAGQVQEQEQLGREALSAFEQFQKDAAQYEELMRSVQSIAGQVQEEAAPQGKTL